MKSETKSKQALTPHNPPRRTEEEIRQLTIGELKPLRGRIVIVEYDSRWPETFTREAEGVRSVLGSIALRLEHVGSTSVPGLPAKPIIDLLLVVADSAEESAYMPALEKAGYVLRIREPDWYKHRMFKGPDTDINMHVFSDGCAEIERMLLFRDWLRDNPADRDLYARTKLSLVQNDWKYVQNYADAKSGIVEQIIQRARLSSNK